MGNALDFLNEKSKKNNNVLVKIDKHIKEKGVTKIEDSKRNDTTHLAKYKENSNDRNDFKILSPYHNMIIIKDKKEYRLEQITEIKSKKNGLSFKAYPIKSEEKTFIIMERQIKFGITKNTITIKKDLSLCYN